MPAFRDGDLWITATAWHDIGTQAVNQRCNGVVIGGQRRDGKGIGRIDHQCGLAALTAFEHIENLQFGTQQTTGRDVLRIHGARQVNRYDERLLIPEDRLFNTLPCGPSQSDQSDHTAEPHQPPTVIGTATRIARQYVRHQYGIDNRLPVAGAQFAAREQNGQHDKNRYCIQPLGAYPVKVSWHWFVPRWHGE